MLIENMLFCKQIAHDKKPLIAVCLNQDCKESCGLCISCFLNHKNHNDDLQTIEIVRKKLDDHIQKMKQNFQFCDDLIQLINLVKIQINRTIQNIQIVQKFSNHADIDKVKELLIKSQANKQDTSIFKKIDIELKKVKEILCELKFSIEYSQSNLNDGQQQEFQECLKQASQVYIQGQYEQAKGLFMHCLKLDPFNIDCKWKIGMCLKLQGFYDQAIGVFDQINAENPNYVESICHKADCLRLQGKYEEALKHFDQTLMLDDKNFVGLSYKGETLRKLQRLEEALIYFDKALMINPKNAITLFGKGDSLRCLKRYDDALYILNQGQQIDPNNILILYSRGYTLKAKGKVQEALECFEKCIAINPQYKNQLEKEIASIKK
ncbi:unnamed protein product [Paramecium sonneborni]|uniref:Tetratricopeptide repeat protein n=1 Tax=Paramecium sonneborni TaxID=65129 RepID=A0A8S1KM05_9CILI|nr:unnamed protein product [Paramecium sonneborni]